MGTYAKLKTGHAIVLGALTSGLNKYPSPVVKVHRCAMNVGKVSFWHRWSDDRVLLMHLPIPVALREVFLPVSRLPPQAL